jgi:hypothetical protein
LASFEPGLRLVGRASPGDLAGGWYADLFHSQFGQLLFIGSAVVSTVCGRLIRDTAESVSVAFNHGNQEC